MWIVLFCVLLAAGFIYAARMICASAKPPTDQEVKEYELAKELERQKKSIERALWKAGAGRRS